MRAKILIGAMAFGGALIAAPGAMAADNSGIVIIDQQHRSTPFGSYNSQRRTEVYGPSSGFRYEEYHTPVVPVYPQYRHYGRGGYAYGPSYGGHGRVFEHPGAGGRYGAPAAPGVHGWGQQAGGDYRNEGHRRNSAQPSYNRPDTGRKVAPAQRAVSPAQRQIKD